MGFAVMICLTLQGCPLCVRQLLIILFPHLAPEAGLRLITARAPLRT